MSFSIRTHLFALLCALLFSPYVQSSESLFLRDNLKRANRGDYLVISFNKTDTLMNISDKNKGVLTIEEIAIPESLRRKYSSGWRRWVEEGAPGHTSWTMYDIDISSGSMLRYYSFSKRGWFEIPEGDNFLFKLLNLRLIKLPESARKKIGSNPSGIDFRQLWQPPMIVDGRLVKGVLFDAWRTNWVKDGSELSGKTIEVYLPQDNQKYPAYFPYWLQVSGVIGKTKIRIIDSGTHLKSPKAPLSQNPVSIRTQG
jgi:hypothetical protein